MDYRNLAEQVSEILADRNVVSEVISVTKNNNVELTGLTVGSETVRPTIYINQMVDEGYTVEEIADRVLDIYENHNESANISLDGIIDSFEDVRPNLRLKLVNIDNKRTLEEKNVKVNEVFDDLIAYPYISIEINGTNGSIKVDASLIKRWGVSADDVYEAALKNTKSDVKCRNMTSVLLGLGVDLDMGLEEAATQSMFVLTNSEMLNGAGALLDTESLREFGKCAVIPSSVHEVIVLPNYPGTADELAEMIGEVNGTNLTEEEVLSDHPYFFESGVYVGSKGFAA